MCTLSWRHTPDAFEVWFNRDESKSRIPAEPPAIHSSSHSTFVAPRDPKGGGTWIVANTHGLVLALLNRYQDQTTALTIPTQSRGKLVWDLATCNSPQEVANQLPPASSFAPFTLVALSPIEEYSRRWDFDGTSISSTKSLIPPICSSGFDTQAVIAEREATYQKSFSTQADLTPFHRSGESCPTAYTVFMRRPDAQTQSITQITLSSKSLVFAQEDIAIDGRAPSRFTRHSLLLDA